MSVLPLSSLMIDAYPNDMVVACRLGDDITYAEFVTDVRCVATTFAGTKSAALVCDDTYYFAVGFYGLLHAGARLVLPPGRQLDIINALQDSFNVLVDDGAVSSACKCKDAVALKPLDPTAQNIDFCTSGSTGAPKFVKKSLQAFDAELVIMDKLFNTKSKGTVFSTVPHHHVYGFTFKVVWALATGHAITTDTYSLWESVLPNLSAGSVLISSPAHLSRMFGLDPLPADKQPQLVLSAGAPLSLEACNHVEEVLGCRPTEIFGSTETGAIATRKQHEADESWCVLPGLDVRRLDDGRMSLSSPFVDEAWIETSDLIELTEDGFIHCGRGDRIVKIEGKRVSLTAVETVFSAHPMVDKVAVLFLKEQNSLAAAVVLNGDGKVVFDAEGAFRLSRQFKHYAMDKGDAEAIPRVWRFIDAFPHHSMGKRRDVDIAALFKEEI